MSARDRNRDGREPLRALTVMRSCIWGCFGCMLALAGCSPEVQIASSEAGATSGGAPAAGSGGTGAQPSGGTPATGGNSSDAGAPAGAEGGGPDQLPEVRILADSVADFALTQGTLGWQYGVDDGDTANFTLMTGQGMIENYKPPSGDTWVGWISGTTHWAQLFQLGAHPNGRKSSTPSSDTLERAVRRWTSNYAGRVSIVGELAKIDASPDDSDGVEGKVLVDGVELYTKTLAGDDGGGVAFSVETDLNIGSTVDFVLDPLTHDHHDLSRFTAVISIAAGPS